MRRHHIYETAALLPHRIDIHSFFIHPDRPHIPSERAENPIGAKVRYIFHADDLSCPGIQAAFPLFQKLPQEHQKIVISGSDHKAVRVAVNAAGSVQIMSNHLAEGSVPVRLSQRKHFRICPDQILLAQALPRGIRKLRHINPAGRKINHRVLR